MVECASSLWWQSVFLISIMAHFHINCFAIMGYVPRAMPICMLWWSFLCVLAHIVFQNDRIHSVSIFWQVFYMFLLFFFGSCLCTICVRIFHSSITATCHSFGTSVSKRTLLGNCIVLFLLCCRHMHHPFISSSLYIGWLMNEWTNTNTNMCRLYMLYVCLFSKYGVLHLWYNQFVYASSYYYCFLAAYLFDQIISRFFSSSGVCSVHSFCCLTGTLTSLQPTGAWRWWLLGAALGLWSSWFGGCGVAPGASRRRHAGCHSDGRMDSRSCDWEGGWMDIHPRTSGHLLRYEWLYYCCWTNMCDQICFRLPRFFCVYYFCSPSCMLNMLRLTGARCRLPLIRIGGPPHRRTPWARRDGPG